jgi:hypothetical protein
MPRGFYPRKPAKYGKNIGLKKEWKVFAEKALGQPLAAKHPIHHLDGIKTGPICICEDTFYHSLLHVRMKAFEMTGDYNKRVCVRCGNYDDTAKMVNMLRKKRGSYYQHRKCEAEYRKIKRRSQCQSPSSR